MKRGIAIAMVIFGLAMVVSGIQKLFPPANTFFTRLTSSIPVFSLFLFLSM